MDRRSRAINSAGSTSTSYLHLPAVGLPVVVHVGLTSRIGMFAHQRVCHPRDSSKATTQTI